MRILHRPTPDRPYLEVQLTQDEARAKDLFDAKLDDGATVREASAFIRHVTPDHADVGPDFFAWLEDRL